MESLLDQLSELRHLPSTVNPYRFLASKLASEILPQVPKSAINQLYFVAATLAVVAVFALISLGLRCRRKIFWVFRYDSRLRLIQPHGAVSWTLVSLVSIILLEVLVARYIGLWQGHPTSDTGYWIFTAWASVWVAGSIAIWSIASSLVLHLAATGRSVDKMALFVNVAGIATPLVVVCVAVPLGVIGGRFYSRTLEDYLRIQENLADQARRWTPGTEFDVSTLVPEIPLFESLLSNIDGLGKFARSTYIFFSVASLSLLCVITSVGGYFLITLRRVLNRSNAMFTTGAKDEGHKRVKRSLNSLILILVAFVLLDAGCFVVSAFGAVHPLSFSSTQSSTALTLSTLYLFCLLGLPCSIILVIGAYHAAPSEEKGHHPSSHSLSEGRRGVSGNKRSTGQGKDEIGSAVVTVVVDIHVDEGDVVDVEEEKRKLSFE
ncbi:hypothetical protein JCM5350_001826 [Sporobolomyces pararoseus]